MKCIDLINEKDGMITIVGCKIGDSVELFSENMRNYCTYCKPEGNNKLYSIIDLDTMSITNPLCNQDILSVELFCEFNQENKITRLSVYFWYCYSNKCDTPLEFKELAKKMANSGRFNVEEKCINSSKVYELIGLSNMKCDATFMWTHKDHSNIAITLDEPICSEGNVYHTERAILKETKRLALKLEKDVDDLNSSELHDVKSHVNYERLSFYEKIWKDKIHASRDAYCDEHYLFSNFLSSQDWDNIYKKAGMSKRDIELYRDAHEPFEAALDDKSDMYRA